jgi:hypothetical protein
VEGSKWDTEDAAPAPEVGTAFCSTAMERDSTFKPPPPSAVQAASNNNRGRVAILIVMERPLIAVKYNNNKASYAQYFKQKRPAEAGRSVKSSEA